MATRRKTTAAVAPAPKTEPAANGNRFTVPEYLTHVAHGNDVYAVQNGVVILPSGESWYRPLVDSGELTPTE